MKATAAPVEPPRLLTVTDAAAYLSTTIWQIRTLAWNKKLASVTLGNRLLFDRKALDQFVDGLASSK